MSVISCSFSKLVPNFLIPEPASTMMSELSSSRTSRQVVLPPYLTVLLPGVGRDPRHPQTLILTGILHQAHRRHLSRDTPWSKGRGWIASCAIILSDRHQVLVCQELRHHFQPQIHRIPGKSCMERLTDGETPRSVDPQHLLTHPPYGRHPNLVMIGSPQVYGNRLGRVFDVLERHLGEGGFVEFFHHTCSSPQT